MARALPFRSVLVTGGTGFVGRWLTNALHRHLLSSAEITVTRHATSGSSAQDVVACDLRDADAVRAAITRCRPDLVVHLAAQASVGQSLASAAQTWAVNVAGTLNLAQAVAEFAPGATLLFASSVDVYGAAFNRGVVVEDSLLAPLSAYGRTKRAAEDLLADVLSPDNRLIVARPTNHSGPGQDDRFVLPSFADQIATIEAGRTPPVIHVGALEAKRDFLDVRDVVDAYLHLLQAEPSSLREVYNIASGRSVAIRHLLDLLLANARVDVTVTPDPARMRPSEVPVADIDATRLRDTTGWRPTRDLETMVRDVLEDRRARHRNG